MVKVFEYFKYQFDVTLYSILRLYRRNCCDCYDS